jgi:hypothetical protein
MICAALNNAAGAAASFNGVFGDVGAAAIAGTNAPPT